MKLLAWAMFAIQKGFIDAQQFLDHRQSTVSFFEPLHHSEIRFKRLRAFSRRRTWRASPPLWLMRFRASPRIGLGLMRAGHETVPGSEATPLINATYRSAMACVLYAARMALRAAADMCSNCVRF